MPTSAPRELRRMIVLLLTNLALTAILAVLLLILRESVVDHQIMAMHVPAADQAATRAGLDGSLWTWIGTVGVIGIVYLLLVRRLRDGRRRSWLRVLTLSVVSLVGIAVNAVVSAYPVWFEVEQAVQALVLLALLWTATRPAVRAHFAGRPASAPA